MNSRIIVAVTGASGFLYAVRLLRFFLMRTWDIDLIVSDAAKITAKAEMDLDLDRQPLEGYLQDRFGAQISGATVRQYDVHAIASPIASGSVRRKGMIVIPCSMKTLAALANGLSTNLIERAADVTLKEGLPLIVVPRETPLNTIQIENMLTLSRAGARVVPAMPAFYHHPQSMDEMADFIVGRVAALMGLDDHQLYRTWGT